MGTSFKTFNAVEYWHRERCVPGIPTFSQSLDNILGTKGVQLCLLTEVLGLPGTGKTQLCLQLCASVQIPRELGGLNAEAVYIDTNTNFTKNRFQEILSASIIHCNKLLGIPCDLNEEAALKRLHYVNAFGLEKFCAFLHRLRWFIRDHLNIKLIVIDSLPFPFKEGITVRQRTGVLFKLMAELQRLAIEKQIAVVVVNEMSTRVGLSGGAAVGALGDAWAHRCNARVLLATESDGTIMATPLKTAHTARNVARFKITQEGIRDIK